MQIIHPSVDNDCFKPQHQFSLIKTHKTTTPPGPTSPDVIETIILKPEWMYCIEGVVIAAQCTATFSRSIVLPRI